MLNRARLRDAVVRRTGLRQDVVAHVLDTVEDVVRDELLQQGEVVFHGLFRVVAMPRVYWTKRGGERRRFVHLVLTIRPVRSMRISLSAVLLHRVPVVFKGEGVDP